MFATVFVLASCGGPNDDHTPADATAPAATSASPAPSQLVGPGEFASAVAEPDRVTINVHVPYEGDIPGTDLSIPFDQIAQQAAKLPAERSTPLAIYCRRGPMSAIAAAELGSMGYTDVMELQGGMQAWQTSGRPLVGP
jgi:rhodanese-related sulfurtransferase